MQQDIKIRQHVIYLGTENGLITYKVSPNMMNDVKYALEYVYKMRNKARNYKNKKNKTEKSDVTSDTLINLPINVEFNKNSPATLNLIEDLTLDDDKDYIIKVKPKIGQDLKYGISKIYQNRRKKRMEEEINDPTFRVRRGPNPKRADSDYDYNINIPDDF